MSEISQNDLNEVARYFQNVNNMEISQGDITLSELLHMVKSPAVAPGQVVSVISGGTVSDSLSTCQVANANPPTPGQQSASAVVNSSSAVTPQEDLSACSVISSDDAALLCSDKLRLTSISKDYSTQLNLFKNYISELKCKNFNEANKNTMKNYIGKIENIHLDILHHVILIQDKIDAKNGEIIELQKQIISEKNNPSNSDDSSVTKNDATDENEKNLNDDVWIDNCQENWEKVPTRHKKRSEKPLTYSDVTKISPFELKTPIITAGNEKPNASASHVLILNAESKSNKMDHSEFLTKKESIKSAIDAKSKKIHVNNISPTKSGGLLMSFPSRDDLEKTKTILDDKCSDIQLKPTYPSKKLPKITVKNIDQGIPDNTIKSVILEQNETLRSELEKGNSVFELIFCKSDGRFTKSAIFRCSPNIRSLIMKTGYFFIDCTRCLCEDNLFIHQCLHCAGFGHTEKFCKLKDVVNVTCVYCAGSHRGPDCPDKRNLSKHLCTNCFHSKNYEVSDNAYSHNATDKLCPIYIRELNKLTLQTDYGNDFVKFH